MNEIGSREKDSRNKENDSPTKSNAQNMPPEWMVAVHAYFTLGDMGDKRHSCVHAWVMLEEKLEYGVHGKGVLPSTKLCPAEWSKWISKTHNSQCCYSATPNLTNSPEFGGAVYAWWQPAFHKDLRGALVDNMDHDMSMISDTWSMLQKGGPNRLVSVLTLLMWWDLNVDLGPWHELSVPQWKVTVRDVTNSL
ncbi:hypothetical protein L208DRAFT_1303351 [Tricholoma matsutake]|nr:hypothetical protein L208DRAFT_1303351 [Tricholoma matsutake 945]